MATIRDDCRDDCDHPDESTTLPTRGERYLRLTERDMDMPRDKDGCATMTCREWIINKADVTAVYLTPDRGDTTDAMIYVRGVKQPIRCCEDGSEIMRELGVPGAPMHQQLAQIAS